MGASVSATTAIIANVALAFESALSSATRSAQTVSPYDAFSTLQPVIDAAVGGQQRRADLEIRVRRDGAVARRRARPSTSASIQRRPMMPSSKRDELVAHAAGRLDHFFLGQRLRQDAGRHVRDARDARAPRCPCGARRSPRAPWTCRRRRRRACGTRESRPASRSSARSRRCRRRARSAGRSRPRASSASAAQALRVDLRHVRESGGRIDRRSGRSADWCRAG